MTNTIFSQKCNSIRRVRHLRTIPKKERQSDGDAPDGICESRATYFF